jgi:hypothetical protein
MPTRTPPSPGRTIEDVHRLLDGPLELVIEDAVAYWLEDDKGRCLSPETPRTIEPFARALELHRLGTDPSQMLLCACLEGGERYEVGGGPILIDMAQAAAGRSPAEATQGPGPSHRVAGSRWIASSWPAAS